MQIASRNNIIDAFLDINGWKEARRVPLAGDASFRKYERIIGDGRQAVLMDAPPEKEDIQPFIRVAEHLLAFGMSAPRIFAQDIKNGLLLLEDLGDNLFARVLEKRPELEAELYMAAADVLIDVRRQTDGVHLNGIPLYDKRLLQSAAWFSEWFLPVVIKPDALPAIAAEYVALWEELLPHVPEMGRVLVHYDYHAENLIWLPERQGVQRAGLLDFQDAMSGSPAFDLMSLLEDARRDVTAATQQQVINYYLEHTGLPREAFMAAYAILGAQRNCKIVGNFIRLAVRDGKHNYLPYLPRVWGHLERDFSHPLLAPLKNWMDNIVKPQWRGAIAVDTAKKHWVA